MVLAAAPYLDDEAVLKHLPWILPEEVEDIMKRKGELEITRFEPKNEPPAEE